MRILAIFGVVLLSLCVWYAADFRIRRWLDLQLHHSDYLEWKENGGEFKPEYLEAFNKDPWRDSMYVGLNGEQLLDKFPYLVSGESYSGLSYKAEALHHFKRNEPNVQLWWLNKQDGFDWCFVIHDNEIELTLIKG